MKARRTQRSDGADTRAKKEYVRDRARVDAAFALRLAEAIAKDPALLDGSAKVVAALAQHEQASNVLEALFARYGRRYPVSHRAFIEARFRLLQGS